MFFFFFFFKGLKPWQVVNNRVKFIQVACFSSSEIRKHELELEYIHETGDNSSYKSNQHEGVKPRTFFFLSSF